MIELFGLEHRAAEFSVWSVMVTAGPAIGGLVRGFLIASLGWQWGRYLQRCVAVGVHLRKSGDAMLPVASDPVRLRARMRFAINGEKHLRPASLQRFFFL